MQPPEPAAVCIELHDVAPATWPECQAILDMLGAAGATRITLLVVPHFHRGRAIDGDASFARSLDARLARGDELVDRGLGLLVELARDRLAVDDLRHLSASRRTG